MKPHRHRSAFTLIELLTVIAIVGVLAAILVPVAGRARLAARTAASTSNLRQLATATHAYVADNRGFFPPGISHDNNTFWHGGRASASAPFEPARGWLGPYYRNASGLKRCPVFATLGNVVAPVFDGGAGEYGYNAAYLAGPPPSDGAEPHRPTAFARLPRPSRTVLFTSSALAVRSAGSVQEYAFSPPPNDHTETGALGIDLQPGTHFRFNGKALVAWCDGRVSAESPNPDAWPGLNLYRGDNKKALVGWFGPLDANGYWNPHYPELAR